jgi:four helix bundle protein
MRAVRSFRDLVVWQRAVELTVAIYQVEKEFPNEERFGLTSQIRRASVSVASNIAEGHGRNSIGEFRQFLGVARGSNFEVQTQLILSRKLELAGEKSLGICESLSDEIERMLVALSASLDKAAKSSL